MTHEEFRFSRHLELWKDQNRLVKRAVLLILLFGFLILFRVLVPFAENTETIGQEIKAKKEAKASIEEKNNAIREIENQLAGVKQTIRQMPWMQKKEELIQTFSRLNRSGGAARAQEEADKTIRAITDIVRNDIYSPLNSAIAAHPEAAAELPELRDRIDGLNRFATQWEADHIGRRWFRTLAGKNEEMLELTRDLNDRMNDLTATLSQTIRLLNQQIQAGDRKISALSDAIDEANSQLKDVLDQLFPKWIKGIINVQQMTQLFPVALVVLMLYLTWLAGSVAYHYRYVADKLNFEPDDKTDVAVSSVWTLADKSRRGELLTIVLYCAIVLVVWYFFDQGMDILYWWLPMAGKEELLLDAGLASAGAKTVHWAGGALFGALMLVVVFYQRVRVMIK